MAVIEVDKLSFAYRLDGAMVPALHNIGCRFERGEVVALTGPSGSGKSTLLNLLGLIEPMQSGEIFFEKRPYSQLSEKEKNWIRKNQIGFIFQNFHLLPVLTAEENVAFFLERQGVPKDEIKHRVKETLTKVGMWEHRKKRPSALSGGQKQRIAVARALAKRPLVIIADEPTASLDQKNGKEVMRLFTELAEKEGICVLLTTHDPMVQSYATRIIKIQDGELSA